MGLAISGMLAPVIMIAAGAANVAAAVYVTKDPKTAQVLNGMTAGIMFLIAALLFILMVVAL